MRAGPSQVPETGRAARSFAAVEFCRSQSKSISVQSEPERSKPKPEPVTQSSVKASWSPSELSREAILFVAWLAAMSQGQRFSGKPAGRAAGASLSTVPLKAGMSG